MPSARMRLPAIIHLEFFVSSRRRHTRWNCDWSSDVCSSDLTTPLLIIHGSADWRVSANEAIEMVQKLYACQHPTRFIRSEERRVGKECRSRCAQYHHKKKTRLAQQDACQKERHRDEQQYVHAECEDEIAGDHPFRVFCFKQKTAYEMEL